MVLFGPNFWSSKPLNSNPRPDFIVAEDLCAIVLLIVTAPVHGAKTRVMEHDNITCVHAVPFLCMFSVHAFRTRLSLPIN